MTSISLSYSGALSDNNVIDMYDAARAVGGFHRSLALTTHLLLNGEIITQAPALKGARIIATTPEEGSWKITAVILTGIWAAASAPKDSVGGHLIFSAYDYVVNSTLGFHVDFDQALGEQYEEELASKKITEEKLDSLIEKTEPSIADMHRPIIASKTAKQADIVGYLENGRSQHLGHPLSYVTYDYMSKTERENDPYIIEGVISSFNVNTYKGRIFVFEEQRPVPFELSENARAVENLITITDSLRQNAARRLDRAGGIRLTSFRLLSTTGRLKSIIVTKADRL